MRRQSVGHVIIFSLASSLIYWHSRKRFVSRMRGNVSIWERIAQDSDTRSSRWMVRVDLAQTCDLAETFHEVTDFVDSNSNVIVPNWIVVGEFKLWFLPKKIVCGFNLLKYNKTQSNGQLFVELAYILAPLDFCLESSRWFLVNWARNSIYLWPFSVDCIMSFFVNKWAFSLPLKARWNCRRNHVLSCRFWGVDISRSDIFSCHP